VDRGLQELLQDKRELLLLFLLARFVNGTLVLLGNLSLAFMKKKCLELKLII